MDKKPETFVCIVHSPLIPFGSRAVWDENHSAYHVWREPSEQVFISKERQEETMSKLFPLILNRWQVEQNPECWKPQYKCEVTGERVDEVLPYHVGLAVKFSDAVTKNMVKRAEQKRQESMARRWAFVPKEHCTDDYCRPDGRCGEGEHFYMWEPDEKGGGKVVEESFCGTWIKDVGMWYIGNIHRTKKEAVEWGKEYAQYFQIPN